MDWDDLSTQPPSQDQPGPPTPPPDDWDSLSTTPPQANAAPDDWDSLSTTPPSDPDAPSAAASFGRRAVMSAPAGAAGGAGGVAGMEAGAALGTAVMPGVGTMVGGAIGGLAGGLAGGWLGSKGEDWILDKMGLRNGTGFASRAQEQQDEATNPTASKAGDIVGQILPAFTGGAASAAVRAGAAAIGGGVEAGSELANGEDLSPTNIAMAAGAQAAFPNPRAWTEGLGGKIGSKLGQMRGTETGAIQNPTANPAPDSVRPDLKQEANIQSGNDDEIEVVNSGPPVTKAEADKANDAPLVTTLGTAIEQPTAPEISGAGNPVGAPMLQREAARPTDPTRDYRKTNNSSAEQVIATQPSQTLSTDPIHADVAAAMGTPPASPEVSAGGPTAPVNTGIEEANLAQQNGKIKQASSIGGQAPEEASAAQRQALDQVRQRQAGQQLGEAFQPEAGGTPQLNPDRAAAPVTAAVKPEPLTDQEQRVIAAGKAAVADKGYTRLAAKIDAMPPKQQAMAYTQLLQGDQNVGGSSATPEKARLPYARPKVGDTGLTARSKADADRKAGSISAIKQAFTNFGPSKELPIDRPGAIAQAKQALDAAKAANNGKDPLTTYMPREKPAEYKWLKAARAFVGKPTAKTEADFRSAHALQGETGQNIEGELAKKQRPQVEDMAEAPLSSRTTYEPFDNSSGDESQVYAHGQSELRDWLNNLDDTQYNMVKGLHPDLDTNVESTQDPHELRNNLMDDLSEQMTKRPGVIETAPAEDMPPAKVTPIRTGADLDRFKETQAGAPASAGKSLKGSPEFERLAAQYGGMKAPDRTGRLEQEEAAAQPVPGNFDAATKLMKDFIGDTRGGAPLPKAVSDWFERKPYDPTSPARDAQIKSALDEMPSWFKSYANGRSWDKQQLAANGVKAAAMKLPQSDLRVINLAAQHDTVNLLPKKLQDAYNDAVKPLMDKGTKLYDEIYDLDQRLGLGLNLPKSHPGIDNNFFPRQRIDEDTTDKENSDPVSGQTLSSWNPVLQPRDYMALTDGAGQRLIFTKNDAGDITVLRNGAPQKLKGVTNSFEGNVGDVLNLKIKGKATTFTVDHAATDEIEAATANKVKYQDNPVVTASNWLNQLQASKANIEMMQRIKDDQRFKDNTTTDRDVAQERGYSLVPTHLPQLAQVNGKDLYMPKNLKWVFDDFHRSGIEGTPEFARELNTTLARIFMTFGSPIHVGNVATNSIISRGFDNITPKGLRSLGVNGVRAWKAVNEMNSDYHDLLKDGGRPQLINSLTSNLIPTITKRMGSDIATTPSKWDPIARIWGVSTPDLARAVENISTREMWRASDMILMQKYLENKDLHGMSGPEAAADAHQFVPAYDLPTTVGAGMFGDKVGRFFSQALADPSVSLFGRYHMDLLRSFAHVTRNVAVGTNQQRIKALGQIAAGAAMAYVIFPAIDKLAQTATGNVGARMGRRGVLAITDALDQMHQGTADYTRFATNLFTPSIPLTAVMGLLHNQDWNGKPIIQKGSSFGQGASQLAGYTARQAVAPYGNIEAAAQQPGANVGTVAGKFAAGMVGLHMPSPAANKYTAQEPKINAAALKARAKKPPDLIEKAYNSLTR